jgi:hypothetical protein
VDGAVGGHGAARGDERLARHLAAEHAGGALRWADAAEQVGLQLFQVEQPDQPVENGLAAWHAVGVDVGNGGRTRHRRILSGGGPCTNGTFDR